MKELNVVDDLSITLDIHKQDTVITFGISYNISYRMAFD